MSTGLSGSREERIGELPDPEEEELDWSNVSYQLSEMQSTLYSIHDQLRRLRRNEQSPDYARRRITAMFLVSTINAALLLAIVILLAMRL